MNDMRRATVGAIVLCAIGCGSSTTSPSADAGSDAAVVASASASAVVEAPAPSATELKNALTFTAKRVSNAGFVLSHTEATQRAMSTGAKEYAALIVHMANYDRQGGDYLPNASKEGQRRVTLNFAAQGAIRPGKYAVGGVLGDSNKLSVGIHTRDEHIGLINGSGEGEITRIDGSTVEGRVTVKDAHGTMVEATFNVPYTIAK